MKKIVLLLFLACLVFMLIWFKHQEVVPSLFLCREFNAINWNIVFSGMTAFGTVGAVIVSLWLARKDTTILRVTASKRFAITFDDNAKERPAFVVLEVTNMGRTPVNIIQFLWRTGCFKKKYAIQISDSNAYAKIYNTPLPRILHPGEQARSFLSYNDFLVKNASVFFPATKFEEFLPAWLRKTTWKIGVDTTLSVKNYWRSITKDLQNDINEHLRNYGVRF